MKALKFSSLLIFLGVALSGCSGTKVTKVDGPGDRSTKGIRYRLPQPYLLVTPKSNGTMTVTEVYLPDDNNIYAVTSQTFLAKHKFQIDVLNGLLTGVTSNVNNAEVISEATTSAGQIAAEIIKAQSANAPDGEGKPPITKRSPAPAPVLYRVVDDGTSVRLEAVNYQFGNVASPQPDLMTKEAPPKLVLSIDKASPLKIENRNVEFTILSTLPTQMQIEKLTHADGTVFDLAKVNSTPNRDKKLQVTIKDISKGNYTMRVLVNVGATSEQAKILDFSVTE